LVKKKKDDPKNKCWFSSLNVPMDGVSALYNEFSSCYVCHSFHQKLLSTSIKMKKKEVVDHIIKCTDGVLAFSYSYCIRIKKTFLPVNLYDFGPGSDRDERI
jgi:hypothetical protein